MQEGWVVGLWYVGSLYFESSLSSLVSWQFRKLQPNPRYVPYIRPSPPYIIDVRIISIYWVLADFLTLERRHSFFLQKPTLTTPQHRSAQSSFTRPRTKSDVP